MSRGWVCVPEALPFSHDSCHLPIFEVQVPCYQVRNELLAGLHTGKGELRHHLTKHSLQVLDSVVLSPFQKLLCAQLGRALLTVGGLGGDCKCMPWASCIPVSDSTPPPHLEDRAVEANVLTLSGVGWQSLQQLVRACSGTGCLAGSSKTRCSRPTVEPAHAMQPQV